MPNIADIKKCSRLDDGMQMLRKHRTTEGHSVAELNSFVFHTLYSYSHGAQARFVQEQLVLLFVFPELPLFSKKFFVMITITSATSNSQRNTKAMTVLDQEGTVK